MLGPSHRAAIITLMGPRSPPNRTEYDTQPISRHHLDAIRYALGLVLEAATGFLYCLLAVRAEIDYTMLAEGSHFGISDRGGSFR